MTPTMDSSSLRERQKERRRARIYNVAIDLFKQGGFQGTTATDIARASNVSRGTFFNYYPYKEAVLLDYGSEVMERLRDLAEQRLAQGVPAMSVLYEIWDTLADENARERDLFPPLAYEVMNPNPERARTAYQALPLSKVVELVLRPLHQEGQIRTDLSLQRISNLIADTYLMVALRWSAYGTERPLKDEMRLALGLLLEGALRRDGPR
ncbi:TetR/AcrR family transcriptional regulator [Deinococcus radiodurans R1 = ATCC 13939 = DSM 20539]|uniref:Transcriptional repressor, TetR family n=2 Tax=Deinococcus radiodurans TaxID=1299 RepID=Q9RUI4_DEIRA|nr:transcriptional repressor, TetR family [Deinococcus radiodurans R1 = ATCC 13939 = DSM 20539]QEM70862.1 TetR/AcrR family transcriptional regulator [Deinococcus radiodurans]UDL00513.1 TetR/AcrR family transcriptional regulator [Deinococcus radiodurans R1 = ATCC 13939 = DSM 20539]HCE65780.1 TetR/AcrR family transcriptional regulator [Deinococcus radiodurans]